MVLPGAVPGPGATNPQSRSYSEQPVLEALAAGHELSSAGGRTALHGERLSLKRACSFPAAVYQPSSKPASFSTSIKPPFKIQLPSIDLSTLSTAFSRHRSYREPGATTPPQEASAANFPDSPLVEDDAPHTNFPPLFTPPDDRPAITYKMSSSDSGHGQQPQQASASEAGKITNPKWASERTKAVMESGEGQGQSNISNTGVASGACEGASGQAAEGNGEDDDSNAHWLEMTMEAAGKLVPAT